MSVKTAEVSSIETSSATTTFSDKPFGIRVSPNSYFIALFLATFAAGLLIYLEKDLAGTIIFAASWTISPLLAWTDRIDFDGKKIARKGILPKLWARLNHSKYRLKISDVEQIETQSLRALKRGGNVFYRYRTTVSGKGLRFVLASGGEDYRRMVRKILPLVPEAVLDNRSIELRDYLSEPKETLMKAEFARIPSAGVLENSFHKTELARVKNSRKKFKQIGSNEIEKADYLHRLANELRLSGYLLQALEAFRRALFLTPRDARLLFDFARCLHSFAGAEHDKNLTRRSFAALRLAEKRAGADGELLARVGESFFQYGDARRAQGAFQKAADATAENFRALRGLAEIALRDGKIAHVIHHFSRANRFAETAALRRWTQNEADYFSRLNADDDYMEMEISRVNLVETLERAKKTCLQIALVSFPAIVVGVALEESLMANIGWSISSLSLLIWTGIVVGQKTFASRIPLDFESEE